MTPPVERITLRDVTAQDAAALAQVLVTANDDAFRGRVPDHILDFSEEESATNWQVMLDEGLPPDDFMVLAQTGAGKVVGYTWGGPFSSDPRYRGELRQIAVLPAYQRRGIGRRLICEVARRLAAQGIDSMLLEVMEVNPNRAFYERLGGRLVSKFIRDWDGVACTACCYGWPDTAILLAAECGAS